MSEEKKEVVDEIEEDDTIVDSTEEETTDEDESSTTDDESSDDDYEDDAESVSSGKYNQALRKRREAETRERELKKELEALKGKEEEEDDDSEFYGDDDSDDDDADKNNDKISKLVDARVKPLLDKFKKQEDFSKKEARKTFFSAHPEYLKDSEKWNELLEEIDNSLNPNSNDDYYTQLEKGHRIIAGDSYDRSIEDKKSEMASDAATSGGGSQKGSPREEFTSEEKEVMQRESISKEAMRALKIKLESGSMTISS